MRRLLPCLAIVLLACPSERSSPAPKPFQPRDSESLHRVITGMESLVDRAESTGLFGLGDDVQLAVKERDDLRRFFAAFFDHVIMLDAFRASNTETDPMDPRKKAELFLLAYAADLALYVNTARFLERTVGRRSYEAVLDEPDPERGIQKGTWRALKTAFNTQPWQRPLLLAHARHKLLDKHYAEAGVDRAHAWAIRYVSQRIRKLIQNGDATPEVAVREWKDLAQAGFQRAWFPAQIKVATWMGDTKVRHHGESLIQAPQIESLSTSLESGDVLVERRNWYLSNVGLPGFWTHAALYIGTPSEAAAKLGAEWLKSIESRYPGAYALWAAQDEQGHAHRLIEAMSEGVVFTSLEHSADADYVGALRPRVSIEALQTAIERALAYQGRPYDFDFDFLSDRSLVCTELVYKCFENNLELPLQTVLGRPTLPANELVRLFDQQGDREDRAFDFVMFLDGREGARTAEKASELAFRASYQRPRWDVVQP